MLTTGNLWQLTTTKALDGELSTWLVTVLWCMHRPTS